MNPNDMLIFVGLAAVIVEVLLGAPTGFDLLLMGIILILGGVVGALTHVFMYGLGVVILLAFLYIFFARKIVKSKLYVSNKRTNTDKFIGEKAMVVKAIAPQKPGQVKIDGEIWRAQSKQRIKEGEEVTIESVEGVTFHVAPIT